MQTPRSSVVQFEIGSVNEIIEVVDNVLRDSKPTVLDFLWQSLLIPPAKTYRRIRSLPKIN